MYDTSVQPEQLKATGLAEVKKEKEVGGKQQQFNLQPSNKVTKTNSVTHNKPAQAVPVSVEEPSVAPMSTITNTTDQLKHVSQKHVKYEVSPQMTSTRVGRRVELETNNHPSNAFPNHHLTPPFSACEGQNLVAMQQPVSFNTIPAQFVIGAGGVQIVPCYPTAPYYDEAMHMKGMNQNGMMFGVHQGQLYAFPPNQLQGGMGNVQQTAPPQQMPAYQVSQSNPSVGQPRPAEVDVSQRPKKRRNRICEAEDCVKNARGRTPFCVRHGGGARCEADGCEKGARPHSMFCSAHGGGHRCLFTGCTKGALAKSVYCRRHGKFTNSAPLM